MGLHQIRPSQTDHIQEYLLLRFPGYLWEADNPLEPENSWSYIRPARPDTARVRVPASQMRTWIDEANWWHQNGRPINADGLPAERWQTANEEEEEEEDACEHDNGFSEDGFCFDCEWYDRDYDYRAQPPL